MASDGSSGATRSEQVHESLKILRQRRGITLEKVRDKAKPICRLSATEIERRNLGLSAEDRHLAAYKVLECGTHTEVPDPILHRILLGTLNFKKNMRDDLDGRRQELQAELFLSGGQYERYESTAYIEFSGKLILLTDSPCRRPPAPDTNLDETVELDIRISLGKVDFLTLLGLITVETRNSQLDTLARRLLAFTPATAKYLRLNADSTGSEILDTYLERINSLHRVRGLSNVSGPLKADMRRLLRKDVGVSLTERMHSFPARKQYAPFDSLEAFLKYRSRVLRRFARELAKAEHYNQMTPGRRYRYVAREKPFEVGQLQPPIQRTVRPAPTQDDDHPMD